MRACSGTVVVALLAATAAAAWPLPGPAAPARTPARATLSTQIGSWACTFSTPGGGNRENVVVVWSAYGPDRIRGAADVPATRTRAAYAADFVMGYDYHRRQWISLYSDSRGGYGSFSSTDPEGATSLTFADAYPVDAADEPTEVQLGATRSTFDSRWTVAGQRRAIHEVCTKQ